MNLILRISYRTFFFLMILVSVCSCTTTYRLSKGTKVYTKKESSSHDDIKFNELKNRTKVKLAEAGDYLIIKDLTSADVDESQAGKAVTKSEKTEDDFRRNLNEGTFYYPDRDYSDELLRYTSITTSFKAVNVSFKYRSQFRGGNETLMAMDSFPSTWESGFNPAVAFGISYNFHTYSASKTEKTYSISLATFWGLGTTDLNGKTTRYPVIERPRKALYTTKGILLNLGVQKWDFGVSVGWDHATGTQKETWAYHGERFFGIILGYDIIKTQN